MLLYKCSFLLVVEEDSESAIAGSQDLLVVEEDGESTKEWLHKLTCRKRGQWVCHSRFQDSLVEEENGDSATAGFKDLHAEEEDGESGTEGSQELLVEE